MHFGIYLAHFLQGLIKMDRESISICKDHHFYKKNYRFHHFYKLNYSFHHFYNLICCTFHHSFINTPLSSVDSKTNKCIPLPTYTCSKLMINFIKFLKIQASVFVDQFYVYKTSLFAQNFASSFCAKHIIDCARLNKYFLHPKISESTFSRYTCSYALIRVWYICI
jgi:hypothetical protein